MKNNFMALILAVFVLIAGSGLGSAADIIVHNGESIQAAVDNSTSVDHIIVEPGTYNKDLDFDGIDSAPDGKTLTLSGQGMPIIRGANLNYADVTLNGFNIKDGSVYIEWANLNIKNCKISNSYIFVYDAASLTATNNQFIKCENAIQGSLDSSIYAHHNKFIDCTEPIIDANRDTTIDAGDNTIINSGKTIAPVPNPTPSPSSITKKTTSSQQNINPTEPSGTSVNKVHPEENITVNCKNDDGTMYEVSVIIEELKDKLDSISESEIYKMFNICFGTDVDSITNASINFSVNNSWIQDNDINQSSIALDEYNNTSEEWDKLPTNITGFDSQAVYCTTNVSSITNNSSFAITANQTNAAVAA